jgi:hypothetical protein
MPDNTISNGILSNSAIVGAFTPPSQSQKTNYALAAQKFTITTTGLKPNTVHYFYYNGVNATASCIPVAGIPGSNLQTDATGSIAFEFYYNSGIPAATALTSTQDLSNRVTGTKQAYIASGDNSSISYVTLSVVTGDSVANSFVKTPISIFAST